MYLNNLIIHAKSLIKTKTFIHTLTTSSGTIINGALGAVFYILLARFLGPEQFGVLSLIILISMLIADIADFGLDTALVKFVGFYKNKDPIKAKLVLSLVLNTFLKVSSVIFVVGFLAIVVLKDNSYFVSEYRFAYMLAIFGVVSTLLFSFSTSALQAYERFFVWGIANISTNLFRVLIIILLHLASALSVESAILIYVLMPLIGFFGGLYFLPRNFFQKKVDKQVKQRVFNFTKWVAVFSAISALSSRIDTLMTAKLLTAFELGIYSAASRLTQVGPQLVSAFGTAVSPKFASMASEKEAIRYFNKLQIYVTFISVLGVILVFPISRLIPILLGSEYGLSVPVFVVLSIGMLIFFASVPIHQMVLYYYGKPKIFMYMSLVNLVWIISVGFLAIRTFGIMGMAYSVLVVHIINFFTPFLYLIKRK